MRTFTNTVNSVLDPLGGSYYTALAFMLLPLHRLCVVSDRDHAGKKYVVKTLVEVFGRQVRNKNSEITGSYEMNVAALTLFQVLYVLRSRNKVYCWTCPLGLSAMRKFTLHIHHFFSSYYKYYTLFRYSSRKPYTGWSPKLIQRCNQMNQGIIQ